MRCEIPSLAHSFATVCASAAEPDRKPWSIVTASSLVAGAVRSRWCLRRRSRAVESLLGQQKYRDAAETFLAASKDYPKAKKAPDMLLKLGVSLVGLKQHDVACATFSEVGKRYPDISSALKERVKQEKALAAC